MSPCPPELTSAREPVQMSHLLRAARTEYAKLEKALTDAEIGNWL